MSRQSKNATNLARARSITKMHLNGEKGPSKTTPKHNKRVTYRSNPVLMKALSEFVAGQLKGQSATEEKTSGKAILRKAGKASSDADED